MPGPKLSPTQLLQRLGDSLHKAASGFPDEWLRAAELSVNRAYHDIVGVLAARGYDAGTIDAWDALPHWNAEQALWHLSAAATNLAGYNPDDFQRYSDQRDWLATGQYAVTVGGVAVAPVATGEVGGIASGTVTAVTAAEERFLCRFGHGVYED